MKKGDRVLVKATCFTALGTYPGTRLVYEPPKKDFQPRRKRLFVRPRTPLEGILIGKTRRATGYYDPGEEYYSPEDIGSSPYLDVDKAHVVWLVDLYPDSEWYRKPFTALEEDLLVISERS